MDQTYMYRYLAQEASEAEIKALFEWIDESAENRKTFIRYKQAWALTSSSQDDSEVLWKSLNKKDSFSGFSAILIAGNIAPKIFPK